MKYFVALALLPAAVLAMSQDAHGVDGLSDVVHTFAERATFTPLCETECQVVKKIRDCKGSLSCACTDANSADASNCLSCRAERNKSNEDESVRFSKRLFSYWDTCIVGGYPVKEVSMIAGKLPACSS